MKESKLHLIDQPSAPASQQQFVSVIVPVALPKLYTYSIPFLLQGVLKVGIRVEVQFGRNKLYSALVYKIHQTPPDGYKAKPILSVLDFDPIVSESQLKLWEWMRSYYACTLGEVMNAALPAGLKLTSESKILLRPDFTEEQFEREDLSEKEYIILQALYNRIELTVEQIREIIEQKTVYQHIKRLIQKKLIFAKESLKLKYSPKTIDIVHLSEPYKSDPSKLEQAFEIIGQRAMKQAATLLTYIQLSKESKQVKKSDLYQGAGIDAAILKKLVDKKILEIEPVEISRLSEYQGNLLDHNHLSEAQAACFTAIKDHFSTKKVVLLHGVTGSGKTQVYIEMIEAVIAKGQQVLYLLPEIALTAQIVSRLQKYFGDKIVVSHSKFNNNERVEIWQRVLDGVPLILGARSALFMPFQNLGLIIVDEEHDPSYKQNDPAPRYNARDTAVFLAHLHQAKTLLGTATPSLESYYNAKQNKYGYVLLSERYGGASLPEIQIIDAGEERRKKRMKSHFTVQLLEAIEHTLAKKEQVILFQNRRGYAPVYTCNVCGWTAECKDCDVSLTYHKHSNDLHCHYCNYRKSMPKACPACESNSLIIKGFGTEKIEDELDLFLPDVKVARMDWDTVKGKHGHEKIIELFASKKVDILVGTQMITKGLDFDNVGLVGVLSADQMLFFPDFRSTERAFQLLLQVSGRAGRKQKKGIVLIQAFNIDHPVLKEVQQNNFDAFFGRELQERNEFAYPPFQRLIKIQLKHKKSDMVDKAAHFLADALRDKLGDRLLGPSTPSIARVRSYFLRDIMIKAGKNNEKLSSIKSYILHVYQHLKAQKGYSTIRVVIDVDPY